MAKLQEKVEQLHSATQEQDVEEIVPPVLENVVHAPHVAEFEGMLEARLSEFKQEIWTQVLDAVTGSLAGIARASDLAALHDTMRKSLCEVEDVRRCVKELGGEVDDMREDIDGLVDQVVKHEESDLDYHGTEALKRLESLEKEVVVVKQRLSGVERSDSRHGLRNKLEKMRIRVCDLEKQMAALVEPTDDEDDKTSELSDTKEEDWDAKLACWREDLREGWPVHVRGLLGRPELNELAGFLGEWHGDRGRWRVRVGTENLLLKPANIFP